MTENSANSASSYRPLSPRLPHFFYGADYNPEQWPEEVWHEDAHLMREAGVNIVSLAIFSWAKLEPRPGQYEFGWLDRVLDILHSHGIKVNLATASASPPPWLAKLHPESLPVTPNGTKLWPGGRQQYCPSNPAYREAATNLVRQLATRYQNHPALAMWHINNEYGCHVSECYCDISAAAFRDWLQTRYGDIESLNRAWGTAFWSQHYADWDEIQPPRTAPTFANPTQQLDWKRFSSDVLLECFEMEAAVLREVTPDVPLTTNFMGFFKPLDYWKWARREDVVSNDSYPDPADPLSHVGAAMSDDLMRSLGYGRPWLLMEQVTSQVNWRPYNALKRPGQMRLWSYQALARGANGLMFFQWRASRAGAEKFHGALVPHVGTENSRIWREVVQLGQELGQLDTLLDSAVRPEVAIMLDWESWWALELDSHPYNFIKLTSQLASYYRPLYERNVAVDFIPPDVTPDKLAGYKVVLLPNLYLTREADNLPDKLSEFAKAGGAVVIGFFSDIVDENEHVRLGGYPAQFRELLGLRVEEFDPFGPNETRPLTTTSGAGSSASLWADLIDLEGAEAVATYASEFYAGRAALTRHKVGAGAAYYFGTQPDAALTAEVLDNILNEAGVELPSALPERVELVTRHGSGGRYDFYLNHNPQPVEIKLDGATFTDLLGGQTYTDRLPLKPYDVAILTSRR